MNRYEFKKYLLEQLPDARQEELIFWKKKIPMPVDIVYRMYDERALMLGLYCDHVLAACIYGHAIRTSGPEWIQDFEAQPTAANIQRKDTLLSIYRQGSHDSEMSVLQESLRMLLMIPEHHLTEERFVHALCHDGRKYKRLYLHPDIRKLVSHHCPEIMPYTGISNGDMFSNIVADVLDIYRMGFADAFSVMFNKLIDFTVGNALAGSSDFSRETKIKVTQEEDTDSSGLVQYAPINDGSLFEPVYVEARTGVRLNSNHPFFKLMDHDSPGSKKFVEMMLAEFARSENEVLNEPNRRFLEGVRSTISRNLRLRIEESVSR